MDFDDQLQGIYGSSGHGLIQPEAMDSGIEHMRVDFGLEKDRGRRFALWAVLYMLGTHLDLDEAFKDQADRESARDFMDLMDRIQKG